MSWYPWLIGWFPLIAPYRQDPEMQQLLEALALPQGAPAARNLDVALRPAATGA